MNEAQVVCKQLNCGKSTSVLGLSYFGGGSGPIMLDDLQCKGNETFIWNCSHSAWYENNCGHNEDISVICSGNVFCSLSNNWGLFLLQANISYIKAWCCNQNAYKQSNHWTINTAVILHVIQLVGKGIKMFKHKKLNKQEHNLDGVILACRTN